MGDLKMEKMDENGKCVRIEDGGGAERKSFAFVIENLWREVGGKRRERGSAM